MSEFKLEINSQLINQSLSHHGSIPGVNMDDVLLGDNNALPLDPPRLLHWLLLLPLLLLLPWPTPCSLHWHWFDLGRIEVVL